MNTQLINNRNPKNSHSLGGGRGEDKTSPEL